MENQVKFVAGRYLEVSTSHCEYTREEYGEEQFDFKVQQRTFKARPNAKVAILDATREQYYRWVEHEKDKHAATDRVNFAVFPLSYVMTPLTIGKTVPEPIPELDGLTFIGFELLDNGSVFRGVWLSEFEKGMLLSE